MKLETLFEKFDLFADAPGAVAKTRELILQLATHGKLVEQNSDEESASALVGRIAKHIEELRSRKEFRGSPIKPLDRQDLPQIPWSWEWVRLGNVVGYGSPEKTESAEIPEDAWLLDLEDIEKNTSRLLQRKSFRESPSKSTKTPFAAGDVLYGKLRPYLNKVIVADAPGYCTTEIIPIRAFGFIDPAYLCQALKRPEFIAYANSKSYGMNLPRLSTADARSAPFPLPPLAEQKRIVAKVDELMALCDRLEAQQQERDKQHAALARASLARFADAPTPANLDFLFHSSFSIQPSDLRKSILTLAVQGKLVPQDPNDEPAEKLFSKLERERLQFADAYKFRSITGESVDHSSVPFGIPASWRWCRLGSMVNAVTDGDHLPPPKSDYGVAFLTIGNITTGKLEFEGSRFVPESYYQGLAEFRRPIRGDILYTVVGATYGRPALVETDRQFCVQRHIAILKLPKNIDVGFLMAILRSPLAYEQATASTTGTAQPTIPLGALRNFAAPLAPLTEQRRIVAKVDQLMALVDQLEAQLDASRTSAANLLSALVAELTAA
ncbi:MAG: restriction endonuclease [Halochromatium sp.]|nr:restriction endonuclease [Halochromatium sp.]